MNKRFYLLLAILVILSFSSYSQVKKDKFFGKSLFVNATGSYVCSYSNDYHFYNHHEITTGLQIGISINKYLYAGLQVLSIYNTGTHVESDFYFIKGIFFHPYILNRQRLKLYGELSVNAGDYLANSEDSYRKKGLYYSGMGLALEHRIVESLYVHFSFVFHFILNNLETKDCYNIPKLGLTYYFGKSVK